MRGPWYSVGQWGAATFFSGDGGCVGRCKRGCLVQDQLALGEGEEKGPFLPPTLPAASFGKAVSEKLLKLKKKDENRPGGSLVLTSKAHAPTHHVQY